MIKNKNLLIIGSESFVGKDYILRYGHKYNNIIGIDLNKKSENLVNYLSIDFTYENSFNKIYKYLDKNNYIIDHVVFTPAVNYMNDIFSITLNDWQKTIDINLKSAIFTMKSIYSFLSKSVSIVFLGSQNGVVGHERRIDYGISKSGLIHLVKNLSIDYSKIKDKDIRVNCISPSYIINENNKDYLDSYHGKKLLSKIPYKKFITLEDTSHAINFLLSDESKSIRGQNIVLDYGYTIV